MEVWRVNSAFVTALMVLFATAVGSWAQTGHVPLPRVGRIDEKQKYANLEGCSNHIVFLGRYRFVFTSDNEGRQAWMNLNGRNVELTLVSVLRIRHTRTSPDREYRYTHGSTRIDVSLRQRTDYLWDEPAVIRVSRSGQRRTYTGHVGAQCD